MTPQGTKDAAPGSGARHAGGGAHRQTSDRRGARSRGFTPRCVALTGGRTVLNGRRFCYLFVRLTPNGLRSRRSRDLVSLLLVAPPYGLAVEPEFIRGHDARRVNSFQRRSDRTVSSHKTAPVVGHQDVAPFPNVGIEDHCVSQLPSLAIAHCTTSYPQRLVAHDGQYVRQHVPTTTPDRRVPFGLVPDGTLRDPHGTCRAGSPASAQLAVTHADPLTPCWPRQVPRSRLGPNASRASLFRLRDAFIFRS